MQVSDPSQNIVSIRRGAKTHRVVPRHPKTSTGPSPASSAAATISLETAPHGQNCAIGLCLFERGAAVVHAMPAGPISAFASGSATTAGIVPLTRTTWYQAECCGAGTRDAVGGLDPEQHRRERFTPIKEES
jgi:hypothetical protein